MLAAKTWPRLGLAARACDAIMDGAMPKQAVGDMAFVEAILHGWDLARGSGQDWCPTTTRPWTVRWRSWTRSGRWAGPGAFGPEVPVPDDAAPFDKVLAQAGRDPGWSAT